MLPSETQRLMTLASTVIQSTSSSWADRTTRDTKAIPLAESVLALLAENLELRANFLLAGRYVDFSREPMIRTYDDLVQALKLAARIDEQRKSKGVP